MERNWWAYRFAKAMLRHGAQMPYDLLFKRGCSLWKTERSMAPEEIADSQFDQAEEIAAMAA